MDLIVLGHVERITAVTAQYFSYPKAANSKALTEVIGEQGQLI